MVFHMKTTLIINDEIMGRLREEAAKRKKNISELVEAALRRMLEEPPDEVKELPPMPEFDGRKMLVDVANRASLYQAMEEGHHSVRG